MLRLDTLPRGRDDDVAEESTTRFYVEATDGKTFEGGWFRGTGLGRHDGYDTKAEADEFAATVKFYDHRPALIGVRVVEEVVTCRITVVTRIGY